MPFGSACRLMLVPLLKRVISEISPHLKKDYPSEEGAPEIYEAEDTFHGSAVGQSSSAFLMPSMQLTPLCNLHKNKISDPS